MNELDDGLATSLSGRYVIERELGRGGMAVVYLARDLKHARPVAVKVLRAEYATAPDNLRFAQEIEIAARLAHPNILALHDSGEAGGMLYYVMPYAEGVTLRQRLKEDGQLPIDEVLEITRQIAAALDYAHARGIIHRDIKPENIFLQGSHVFIADFGIAKAIERSGAHRLTGQGMLIGTPEYMSPEQCLPGETISSRSDIYALGCVVFEMVAGVPPFRGASASIIMQHHLTTDPPSLGGQRRSCPPELEAAVQRALAKVPADRFQTATEFAVACRPTDVTTSGTRLERRIVRRRFAITTALVVAVAAIAVVATFLMSRAPTPAVEFPEGDARRIAVLYFANLSPRAVPAYIVDGITEDLIDHLGAASALHVLSPEGVRPYRAATLSTDSVGRLLRVGTIISGSVARADSTLVIHVRLIDARSGRQLFSRSLTLPWAELFALQGKLVDEVAFLLRQQLGDAIALREDRAATSSSAAWATVHLASEVTRRALVESNLRGSAQGAELFLRADSLYARAATLDPQWVLPPIKRGRLALALSYRSPAPPPELPVSSYLSMSSQQRAAAWIQRALVLANDALRIAKNDADALSLRGDTRYALAVVDTASHDSLLHLAETDLRAALERRPDLASAWATLAQLDVEAGRFAAAAAEAQRAFDADAFFEVPRIASIGFFASLQAEQFDEARQWCRLGLDHYRGDPRFTECELTLLGWTGRSQADVRKAWALVSSIERVDTLDLLGATWGYRRLMVATVLARSGLADSASHTLTRVLASAQSAGERRSLLLPEANIRLILGDRATALDRIQEYLRAAPKARAQVANHPWFASLRGDPRYETLTKEL